MTENCIAIKGHPGHEIWSGDVGGYKTRILSRIKKDGERIREIEYFTEGKWVLVFNPIFTAKVVETLLFDQLEAKANLYQDECQSCKES